MHGACASMCKPETRPIRTQVGRVSKVRAATRVAAAPPGRPLGRVKDRWLRGPRVGAAHARDRDMAVVRAAVVTANIAVLTLSGCSLSGTSYHECEFDSACAEAFGPGSVCDDGFCSQLD